jgi:uncharacterized protein
MVIDVRLVPEGRSSMEQSSELAGFRDGLPPFSDPVRCRAEIDRAGGTIAVSLRFSGVFEAQCARCLESYGEPVEGALRVIIKEEQGRRGPFSGDGGDGEGADFFFDANHDLVDIGQAIYDEIMVSLPLKPLCSEGCEGIKIEAGADVSAGGGDKPADPRWEGLMKLKAGNR